MAQALPADIAAYGHIATALREFLARRDWRAADLAEAVTGSRHAAIVNKWVNGTGGVSAEYRPKLAKLTGLPATHFERRKPGDPAPSQAVATLPAPAKLAPVRVGDVLSFAVTANGEARIKLDIVLPLASATPLLRMLLDAGIVFGEGAP